MEGRITSDNITKLSENEVFVFGSNLVGKHGKEMPYNSIKKRNGKLNKVTIVTSKFYTCDLTEEEREIKHKRALATSAYFERMREDREELEKRHG